MKLSKKGKSNIENFYKTVDQVYRRLSKFKIKYKLYNKGNNWLFHNFKNSSSNVPNAKFL